MKKIKLSIIVACYNVEKYLNDCIESLYVQDIPVDEYEVVCVDDCSTDSTPDLLKKFEKKHNNFHVIHHDTNKKVGAARNTGRKVANGTYIWFIDGDDIIMHHSLKSMVELCDMNAPDILLFNFRVINENGTFVEKSHRFSNSPVLNGYEFIRNYFPCRISELTMVWTQLYRRDFLNKHNIQSPEINMGEDSPFAWRSLFLASSVMSVENDFYQYRANEISMTQEFRKHPTPVKVFEKSYVYSLEILKLYEEFKANDAEIAAELLKDLRWSVNTFRQTVQQEFNDDERRIFYRLTKRIFTNVDNPLKSYFSRKTSRCVFMMNLGFNCWNQFLSWSSDKSEKHKQLIINMNSQLGNQMFYYALYLRLISNGRKVKFDTRYYKDHPNHYRLDIFIPEIPVASENEILAMFDANRDIVSRVKRKIYGKQIRIFSEIEKTSYAFDPDIFQVTHAYVDGYWQSEQYFTGIRHLLLKTFTFPAFSDERNIGLLKRINENYTVSIHVRRGDYLNGFPLMTPEYYQQAMSIFNNKFQKVFYIVLSNDLEWAKDNIKFDEGVYVDWNTGSDSYRDMQLMTHCNSNIIANSSFSWWGAWLNNHEDKIVVAPSVWLNGVETPDIYANNWIII